MPTAPGYADCSVELQHVSVSRPAYITFGVDPTDTDPLLVGNAVIGAIVAASSLLSLLDSNVTVSGVRVSLGTDGGEDLVGYAPSGAVGGRTLIGPTPNVAVLFHKHTARGGRRGRGRFFVPWCIATTNLPENGVIPAPEVTVLQNAMSNFRTLLSTGSTPMVVLHQASRPGTEHPTTPGAPNVVTSITVDKLISTQRRRLGR